MTDEPMFCPAHGTPMGDLGPTLAARRLACARCMAEALGRIAAMTFQADDLAASHGWIGVAGKRLLEIRDLATRATGGAPCPKTDPPARR